MTQETFWGVPIPEPKPAHEGEYTPDFETFWKIHPVGGKRPAFKGFLKAIPEKVSRAEAETFLWAYRDRKVDDQFDGCNLSTWLNQEYWEQERERGPHHDRPSNPMSAGILT